MTLEKYLKNRGFMTLLRAPVKNGPEVMALLNALQLPVQVAILKMKAHGKLFTGESKGHDLAGRAAKVTAKQTPLSPKPIRKYTLDTLQHIRDMQSNASKVEVWEWMAAGCKLSQEGVWKYNMRCVALNALLPYLGDTDPLFGTHWCGQDHLSLRWQMVESWCVERG